MNPAVVFDLDGTLVDTLGVVYDSFRYGVEPFRKPPTDEEIEGGLCGPVEKNLLLLLNGNREAMLKARARLAEYAREHQDKVSLFPGSKELIEALSKEGINMGLWTGRDRKSSLRILERFGLRDFFKGIICGDDLKTHKPHPEGLLKLMVLLGATPKTLIFVGDSEHDIMAGKHTNIKTIIFLNSHHPFIRPADIAVKSHTELKTALFDMISKIKSEA